MCQLNLYMVPKNVPVQKVMDIFEENNLDIIVSEHYKLDEFIDNYEFYCTSGHCDCNSIISRLQEEDISSFEEYKIKKKQQDIEKLNRIKALKATDDYEVRVKEFENERDIHMEALEVFHRHIFDYESQESERISSLNLQDEERIKELNKAYLLKLKELHNELIQNEEYQNTMKKYSESLSENNDLFESTYFNIEEFEKEFIENEYKDFYEEFCNLKNVYTKILEVAEEICIYPFWQNEELLNISEIRKIAIESLCIEDLIFLPYKTLLKIQSVKVS